VLKTIARQGLDSGVSEESLDPALVEDLSRAVNPHAPVSPVTDGEIARSALQLLASNDLEMERRIVAIAATPAQKFIDPVTSTLLLGTAIVVILRTKIDLRRDQRGWTFEVSKPSVATKDLADFVGKLIPWYRSGK
jgi:hypothetical protein